MTCIVGIVDGDRVVLGGDGASTDSWAFTQSVRAPKVFTAKTEGTAMSRSVLVGVGFTSAFRFGQLIEHRAKLPAFRPENVERWLAVDFLDAVRKSLSDGGWERKKDERAEGGTMLVAVAGRLFKIGDEYGVTESHRGFDACGSGYLVACGALSGMRRLCELRSLSMPPAEDAVLLALRAASECITSVRGPHTVIEVPK